MKKLLLPFCLLLTTLSSMAYDAKINGIYYNFSGNSATVTYETNSYNSYSGNVTIPEKVSYNGNTYSVTTIGKSAFRNSTGLTSVTMSNNITNIEDYAFRGCSGLKSITIPGSVRNLGEESFRGCSGLTSVTISDGVMYVSYGTFMSCTGLTSVSIPNSVTDLSGSCFEKCTGLVSVSIGSGVTEIGTLTFSGCTNLKDLYCYASKVLELDQMYPNTTFQNVPLSEATLHVPDYLIEKYKTTENWSKFGKIVGLGAEYGFMVNGVYYAAVSSVEPLAVSVFGSEEHVGNLDIPETVTYGGKTYNVTSIGEGAFEGQVRITAITIPSGITTIGKNVFSGCTALTSVTINSNAIASVDYDYESESYKLSDYFGTQVKHYAFGGEVKRIGNNVGEEFDEVETVIIGNGVIEIGYDVFYRCQSLKSVTIGNEVETIGDGAFADCPSLESLTLGNKVSEIGEEAFCVCPSLTSLFIPASVAEIGEWAFVECSGLEKIVVEAGNLVYDSRNNCNALIETESNTLLIGCANTNIPKDVESIFEDAFYGCRGLKQITIPASVKSIGDGVFTECSGLENIIVEEGNEIYDSRDNCNAIIKTETNALIFGCNKTTIPSSVTSIESDAFYGSGIQSMTIPDNVIFIGGDAFYNCKELTFLHIGTGITNIRDEYDESPFIGCTSLKHIEVAVGNTVFDSRNNCSAIIETTTNTLILGCMSTIIPDDVTNISKYAFFECKELTSITIPNSVTTIGVCAFEGCTGVSTITIPASVANIESSAFYDCTNLQSIYCLGEAPAEIRWPFDKTIYEQAVLYVPYGSIDAYRNDTFGWGEFYDIREFDPTKVEGTLDIENSAVEYIYDLSGRSQQRMQKGINIIRMSNGTVRKVLVK